MTVAFKRLIFCALVLAPRLGLAEALELTVWNRPAVARANERQIWDREKADFESKNPGITIRPISRDYIQQQFVTVMAGGKGPDVVHLWVGALPTLAGQDFLAPL